MHVCFDIRKVDLRPFRKPAVTLGTFDGVHLGHRAIITRLLDKARKHGTKAVVVTYEPHPQRVVSPRDAPEILSTLEEKLELLHLLAVEETVVINFDRQLQTLSPREFLEETLLARLDPGFLVVGDDHAFGKGRAGRIDFLKEAAPRYGFDLEVVPALCVDGARISSTGIRKELKAGEFTQARSWLGHAYPLFGSPLQGKGRGKKLGYPTLNLKVPAGKLLPKDGVYGVTAQLGEEYCRGMMYIGSNLTFDEHERGVEVHLFDLEEPPSSGQVRVWMEGWIRAPEKFADAQGLKGQLKSDEQTVRRMFETNCFSCMQK
jgi:riboflavin kinase/FMN adenylyltransferase